MRAIERCFPDFEHEFATTRKFLELVPDDKLLWKPHPKSMELGRLAWHLSGFPDWCRKTIELDCLCLTREAAEVIRHVWKEKRRADMLDFFDRELAPAQAALATLDDAALARHWKLEWCGQVVVDMPRDKALRLVGINHMIHHRAQFSVYLRLNGIAIPGAYGPSADEVV